MGRPDRGGARWSRRKCRLHAGQRRPSEAKDWTSAIQFLSKAEVQDDRNPDLENLLGYAYRNIGRFDEAFRHYEVALRLNPRHRGAHEYIGEAYLMVNNLPQRPKSISRH